MKLPRINTSKFKLGYDRPGHFYASQWQNDTDGSVSVFYLAFRIVLTLFFTINWMTNLITTDFREFYMIYLTDQGLLLVLAHDLFHTSLVAWRFYSVYRHGPKESNRQRYTFIILL